MNKPCALTELYRAKGTWDRMEINRIKDGLNTTVRGSEIHPEYLILEGHFTKDAVLEAMQGGKAFTVLLIRNENKKELPAELVPI